MMGHNARVVTSYIAGVSAIGLIVGPCIIAWQIFRWLKDGVWSPISVETGVAWAGGSKPLFSWLGVQRISDWVMGLPLSVVLFFCAMGVLLLVAQVEDALNEK